MNTAIRSLGDKLHITRREFYAGGIAGLLARIDSESATEQLNALYSNTRAEVDALLYRAQLHSLKHSPW